MVKEIPDWVENTRPEHSYQLVLFESNDASAESVDMTRGEYIALKRHLAALRGYTTGGEPLGCFKQMAGEVMKYDRARFGDDPQQLAANILLAREVYRICPDAVVFDSPSFAAKLCEIGQWEGEDLEDEDDPE